MSTTGKDPRQPSAARRFVAPAVAPENLPIDYAGFIAIVFGVVVVMFRYKLGSWFALICCAHSLGNMKNLETDLKQIAIAVMFAIMGIMTMTNYFGPPRPGSQS